MNNYSYKLVLQYNGQNYLGWQSQKESSKTIQGTLNQAAQKLFKVEQVKTIASGRTDAGVHALDQIVKLEMPLDVPESAFLIGLNGFLPGEIRIKEASKVDNDFHPLQGIEYKEYLYFFQNSYLSPFQNGLVTNINFEPDIKKMQEACRYLLGERDFVNFMCEGTPVKSTVRKIHTAQILMPQETSKLGLPFYHPKAYCLQIASTGFLKQMVRMIMGALFTIAQGKKTVEEFHSFLENCPVGERFGPVAPSDGLYLSKVNYKGHACN